MSTSTTKTGAMTTALLAGVLAASLQAQPVLAQDAPPPPPPPADETVPSPPPAPPPAPVAPEVAVAPPAETPMVSTTPPKESFKKMDPPAIWFRLDNQIRSKTPMTDNKKLNGFVMGSEVDVLFSGQVHEYVAWQADFVGVFGNAMSAGMEANDKITGKADILDLIGKFQLHDTFNLWVGRMLVPSDRSNFSGPWFMSAWNYPNVYGPVNANPRQGPFGRNDGATLWGQLMGGHIKYYVGAFDLHSLGEKALYSGRLNLTLLNPEPGYYHSSTYYGGKDIVALGVGGQYKKDGSTVMGGAADDYSLFNVDLLAEKSFGGAGTATLEGAFYNYSGDAELLKNSFYVLASYLIPMEVGIGRFQPLVRFQQGDPKAAGAKNLRLIDAAISYVVDQYAMRIALNYQNQDLGGLKGNAINIGIQIQK